METNIISVVFVLTVTLFVVWSAKKESGFFANFYKWVPSILLLYLLPAVAVNSGLMQPDKTVRLLAMDSALPLCLIILTAIINLPDLLKISRPGLITILMGTDGWSFTWVFSSHRFVFLRHPGILLPSAARPTLAVQPRYRWWHLLFIPAWFHWEYCWEF